MEFAYKGELWVIEFKHEQFTRSQQKTERRKGYSLCTIRTKDKKKGVVGHAECSLSDQFNRRVGRKLTLNRALEVVDDVAFSAKAVEAYEARKPAKVPLPTPAGNRKLVDHDCECCECSYCRAYERYHAEQQKLSE